MSKITNDGLTRSSILMFIGDDSVQPSKSQSSAESTADEDVHADSHHGRVQQQDGGPHHRSSSETSAESDKYHVDTGQHSPAVLRGCSVDEGILFRQFYTRN